MNSQKQIQIWDLWYPQAAATGVPFARGRLDATDVLIVHAPPPMLTVEVRTDNGRRLAMGVDLPQTADRPMARLTRRGDQIIREDVWPTADDIGDMRRQIDRAAHQVRAQGNFHRRRKPITRVQSRDEKDSSFAFSEFMIVSPHPARSRGALRERHETLVRDAMAGFRRSVSDGSSPKRSSFRPSAIRIRKPRKLRAMP